jgi:hypothetical protein
MTIRALDYRCTEVAKVEVTYSPETDICCSDHEDIPGVLSKKLNELITTVASILVRMLSGAPEWMQCRQTTPFSLLRPSLRFTRNEGYH